MLSSNFRNNEKSTLHHGRDKIKKILSEYKLQRSNFNPHNKSPNIFMNNLKRRMGIYYNMVKKSD